jgi:hypothetical protein
VPSSARLTRGEDAQQTLSEDKDASRLRFGPGVARRLAVLLMSLWKSGETYDPLRHSRGVEKGEEVAA